MVDGKQPEGVAFEYEQMEIVGRVPVNIVDKSSRNPI
jgi:hypothetical protein